jgi:hypothetical protein
VLHELDAALRALVQRDLGDTDVAIDLEAPTKEWAAHRNQPTINIYLYDLRQDVHRNHVGQVSVRDDSGQVTGRRPQPKFFRLSYLVTAWTQRPEDEHRLLSALLVTFLRHETVPPELLTGSLAELGIPLPLAAALPPPQDRALSDVWSALGGELKPSIDVGIIAPLLPDRAVDAGPPVLREPVLKVVDRTTGAEEELGLREPREGHVPGAPAPDRRPPPPQPEAASPKRASRRRARS